jgi:hypothetical protein
MLQSMEPLSIKFDLAKESTEKQMAEFQAQRRTDLAVLTGVLLMDKKGSASSDNQEETIHKLVAFVNQVAPPSPAPPSSTEAPSVPPKDSQG